MENNKKASDVILEMNAKINSLLDMVRSLDLNMKIISNKLNLIQNKTSPYVAETQVIKTAPTIISPDVELIKSNQLKEINNSESFSKRGSRNDVSTEKFIAPKPIPAEKIIVSKKEEVFKDYNDDPPLVEGALIPVSQKVYGENGKPIFLAEISIRNTKTNKIVKTKTSGRGVWQMPLEVGKYEIIVGKRLVNSKEKKEIKQIVVIDGTQVPFEADIINI